MAVTLNMTPQAGMSANNPVTRLQLVAQDVAKCFIKRDEMVLVICLALIAHEHIMEHGAPGGAKSDVAYEVTKRITGANYFQIQGSADLSRSDLVGPVSINGLLNDCYTYLTDGYLPWAHVAVLDEMPRFSDTLLDDMLAILNERQFKSGTTVVQCPLITAIGTANTKLTGKHLANADRWLFRLFVKYLEEDKDLLALDQLDVNQPVRTINHTIDLADLQVLHSLIPVVKASTRNEVWEAKLKIIKDLRSQGFVISDRRYKKLNTAIAAHALFHGRNAAELEDLEVLRYTLPDTEEQLAAVTKAVGAVANPAKMRAIELEDEARELYDKVAAYFGKTDEASKEACQKESMAVTRKLGEILTELEDLQAANPHNTYVPGVIQKVEDWQEQVLQKGALFRGRGRFGTLR